MIPRPLFHNAASQTGEAAPGTSCRGSSGTHTAAPVLQRVRVLVIDDSDTARARISALLRHAGCVVHELPSAIGATRVALHEGVDAAVVDVSMPGLSGDKLVSVFRGNQRLHDLVIVLVSGHAESELEHIAETCAVDGVMEKSRVQTELVPLLQRVLSHRRHALQ